MKKRICLLIILMIVMLIVPNRIHAADPCTSSTTCPWEVTVGDTSVSYAEFSDAIAYIVANGNAGSILLHDYDSSYKLTEKLLDIPGTITSLEIDLNNHEFGFVRNVGKGVIIKNGILKPTADTSKEDNYFPIGNYFGGVLTLSNISGTNVSCVEPKGNGTLHSSTGCNIIVNVGTMTINEDTKISYNLTGAQKPYQRFIYNLGTLTVENSEFTVLKHYHQVRMLDSFYIIP